MKSFFCSLFVVIVCAQSAFAQTSVLLFPTNDHPNTEGSRSVIVVPTATLDGTTITLTYPLATESQVVITDQSTQTVAYSETFTATRSLTIDLSDEGIEGGTYTLRVYAFGKWWIGEFELDTYSSL